MARKGGRFGRAAKRVGRRVRRFARRVRAASRTPDRAILPTVLGLNAASAPFVTAAPNAPVPQAPTVMEAVSYAMGAGAVKNADGTTDEVSTALGAIRVGLQTLNAATVAAIPSMATNAGLAIGENWLAKKSGARKATKLTKKWSAL